ncbi:MAG: SCO family protein [Gammaproteobacteria bacterium]|nr:SCO family protein [Gammaproteobacteria bacterium]
MPHSRKTGPRRLLYATTFILLSIALHTAAHAGDVPNVVVSSKPLHALLSGLMRGVATPRLLIDGSVAPWNYVPGADDATVIGAADALVWSGRELEPGLATALRGIALRGPVFEALASNAMKVLPSRYDERLRDPFFWLDSRNMVILLDQLRDLLIAIDPDRAQVYERNARLQADDLGALDRVLEFGYRDVSGVPVFFYHDTHRYFAQAYAMNVAASAVEVAGGEQVETARLLSMHADLVAAGRACLFVEKGLVEPQLELLRHDTDAITVELDSLGSGIAAGPDAYRQLMRENFAAIGECVRRTRAQQGAGTVAASSIPAATVPFNPRYLLMDQYGNSVSNEDFAGRLQLINFGYTFCPDVCPTSLAVMAQAVRLLGDDAAQVQPIFITVDPQRDTPDVLGEYVRYFDPRMLGLSASPQIIERTAALFHVQFEKVPADNGDPLRYSMDHTASLFLLGRHGEFLTKFAYGLPASEVAARLRDHLGD